MAVCYYHVTYAFHSESTLYSCLNVKGLLARNRWYTWSLSDSNGIQAHNDWVFAYGLSGCVFQSHCCRLNEECSYTQKIRLTISGEIMLCRKVTQILWYHLWNKFFPSWTFCSPCAAFLLSVQKWKAIVFTFYINVSKRLLEEGLHDLLNIKKIKFEPHGDFADQAFLQSNENLMNNKDPKTQNGNDETPRILPNDESSICFGPMIMQDISSIMLNQRHR